MKFRIKNVIFLLIFSFALGEAFPKRITFDHTQGKSPFKFARMGSMIWYTNTNDYIASGKDRFQGSIVKISFPENDTTLLIDSSLLIIC